MSIIKRTVFSIVCLSLLVFSCKDDKDNNGGSNVNPTEYFKVIEVSGTHYEIGYQIGENLKNEISEAFIRADYLFNIVDEIIAQDSVSLYWGFVNAVNEKYPQFIEELNGMADGSGLPFKKFMILSTISEYIGMLQNGDLKSPLGCSSVLFSKDGLMYLSHNEDGSYDNGDIMSIVKVHPTGKPSFINFYYPGMVLGVAPAMNDEGIFYSGNYINGTEVNVGGIPNSFIQRSLMEAENLNEAISLATITDRAYCFNVNIASKMDGKMVTIEVAPSAFFLQEVDGFFVHTNHFYQEGMESLSVPDGNSISRYSVLKGLTDGYASKLNLVEGDLLTEFLSSHEGAPDSPCSHGGEGVAQAQTLGSTLFDIEAGTWRISYLNPCENKFQMIKF
jgi:isopenicillin-N N-acyltransferase like protein